MVVIGALSRVEMQRRESVVAELEAREGVSTFAVGDPLRLGILLECASTSAARDLLARDIASVEGITGVWPLYLGQEQAPVEPAALPGQEAETES